MFLIFDPSPVAMLFLDLLPGDLHVDILQSWIGLGLSVLSALDMAVCSRADRPHLHECLQQACRNWRDKVTCNNLIQCLTWMARRHIPVAGLAFNSLGNHQAHDMPAILLLSHEVKHISYWLPTLRMTNEESVRAVQVDETAFWEALLSVPLDHLDSLSYMSRTAIGLNEQVMEKALQVIGSRLRSLHLTCGNALHMVATHCLGLHIFTCSARDATVSDFVDVVRVLKHLTTLTISGFNGMVKDIQMILHAGEQLRCFRTDCYGLNC